MGGLLGGKKGPSFAERREAFIKDFNQQQLAARQAGQQQAQFDQQRLAMQQQADQQRALQEQQQRQFAAQQAQAAADAAREKAELEEKNKRVSGGFFGASTNGFFLGSGSSGARNTFLGR